MGDGGEMLRKACRAVIVCGQIACQGRPLLLNPAADGLHPHDGGVGGDCEATAVKLVNSAVAP